MPVALDQLIADLAAETEVVDAMIADLDPAGWVLPTPAEGWTIADQIGHLAYFDDVAVLAVVDPDRFRVDAEALEAHGPDFAAYVADRRRSMPPVERLAWFRRARRELLEVYAPLEARTRIPWYGPPMSVASSVTARLMETWAHGQDIADGLGVSNPPTLRLRHVAHLGVQTFAFAFRVNGLEVPTTGVRVELGAPDGTTWTWGDAEAAEVVSGPALDFCLVVTQRRHPAETALATRGGVAERWLSVAQAFAGPPGPGRPAGGAGPPAGPAGEREPP